MSIRTNCPVCQTVATPFLHRHRVPVHQNLVMSNEQNARSIARGDLEMRFCQACGFVFNAAFDLSKMSYDEHYNNNQTYSGMFRDHVDDLVRHLVQEKGIKNCRIVEVGCGQGDFLRKLVESPHSGNSGYGFDPAYCGAENDVDGRLQFQKRFYDAECADVAADAVICRHVIEHVPDPVSLLQTVRAALARSPGARVFFETPSIEWILRHEVLWDFFYEHCSYWTPASLTTAFQAAGFRVEEVQPIFGGQYLWLEATSIPLTLTGSDLKSPDLETERNAGNIPHLAQQIARRETKILGDWKQQIETLSRRGKVALWGAGAKGVTLSNLLDVQRQWFDCVVDLNPHKQGCYIAGSAHPIVAPQEIKARQVKTAILMNPNYRVENLALLHELHLDVDLVDLGADAA